MARWRTVRYSSRQEALTKHDDAQVALNAVKVEIGMKQPQRTEAGLDGGGCDRRPVRYRRLIKNTMHEHEGHSKMMHSRDYAHACLAILSIQGISHC